MKNLIYTAVVGLTVCLTSCIKQKDLEVAAPESTNLTGAAAIEAADGFKWSTSKVVKLSFKGVSSHTYHQVLKVEMADGSVLFQQRHQGNQDIQVEIEVPATTETLSVSFGETRKALPISNNTLSFSAE